MKLEGGRTCCESLPLAFQSFFANPKSLDEGVVLLEPGSKLGGGVLLQNNKLLLQVLQMLLVLHVLVLLLQMLVLLLQMLLQVNQCHALITRCINSAPTARMQGSSVYCIMHHSRLYI